MTPASGRDRLAPAVAGYEPLAERIAALLDAPAVCVLLAEAGTPEPVACHGARAAELLAWAAAAGTDAVPLHGIELGAATPAAVAGRVVRVPFRTSSGTAGAVCILQDTRRERCRDTELRLVQELAAATAREAAACHRVRSLEAVIETQSESIQVVGADGGILNMNAAGLRTLGRERLQDVLGADFTAFIAPEHRDLWFAAQARVLTGREQSIEFRLVNGRGSQHWVAMHMVPFRDGRGRIAASLSVMADIEERRLAEDAVVRYLSTLRGTLEATADGILVTDVAGRITAHNRRFCRKWGLPDDALAGDGLGELLLHMSGRLSAPASFETSLARIAGEPHTVVCEQVELKDGRVFEIVSQPQWLEGIVTGRVWSVRDLTERVTAERALRASEEQFRSIIENTADIVFAGDVEGRILYISPSVERILGYAPADLVGTLCLDLAHPDDYAAAIAAQESVLRADGVAEVRLRVSTKTGDWRWLHMLSQLVPGEDGRPVIVTNARDVTDLEQAERELHASNEMLRTILAAMPLAVIGLDGAGVVRMWNRTAEHMFGWTAEEVIGRPYMLSSDGYRDQHLAALKASLAGQALEGLEAVRVCKDGSQVDVAIWTSAVKAGDGTPAISIGLLADITEKKRVEDRLRRNEQRFRALIENALDVTVMLELDGTIRFGSPSGERLLGFERNALKGRSILDLIHPDDLPSIRSMMAGAREAGHDARMVDVRVRHADGTFRVLEGLAKSLLDDDGRCSGLVVNARDITARKQLEAQLRQAQKMEAIGKFAGGVAHDFNNMLTAIKGFAILLDGGCDNADEHGVYTGEIRKAADRAAALTRQLLAFSRQQILQPRIVDMNAVIEDMSGMLQRLLGAGIDLRCRLAPGLRPVMADPTQVEQVIMNLAVNARDAMVDGGTVDICTANETLDAGRARARGADVRPGDYVVLSVVDNGCGMDETTRSRIFDPFFTTKPVGQGTGLGLSTVYGIITQSGGHVHVNSSPMLGTCFEIFLPAAAGECRPASRAEDTEPAQPASGTILLVDDEPGVRFVARRILERCGFTVIEAAGADEALDRVLEEGLSFDVLLTDVVMPGMNGSQLAAQLARSQPGLRVVLMSGYSDVRALPRELDGIDCTYLAKPFDPAELRKVVQAALDAPSFRSAPAAAGRPAESDG